MGINTSAHPIELEPNRHKSFDQLGLFKAAKLELGVPGHFYNTVK
jgi:hypothetical protein